MATIFEQESCSRLLKTETVPKKQHWGMAERALKMNKYHVRESEVNFSSERRGPEVYELENNSIHNSDRKNKMNLIFLKDDEIGVTVPRSRVHQTTPFESKVGKTSYVKSHLISAVLSESDEDKRLENANRNRKKTRQLTNWWQERRGTKDDDFPKVLLDLVANEGEEKQRFRGERRRMSMVRNSQGSWASDTGSSNSRKNSQKHSENSITTSRFQFKGEVSRFLCCLLLIEYVIAIAEIDGANELNSALWNAL